MGVRRTQERAVLVDVYQPALINKVNDGVGRGGEGRLVVDVREPCGGEQRRVVERDFRVELSVCQQMAQTGEALSLRRRGAGRERERNVLDIVFGHDFCSIRP